MELSVLVKHQPVKQLQVLQSHQAPHLSQHGELQRGETPSPPFSTQQAERRSWEMLTEVLLHLCMGVEELKESHNQGLQGDVAILVLLQVVGQGLPLRLRQEQEGLLLQAELESWRSHRTSGHLENQQ